MRPVPAIYWQWWQEIAECEGLPLPFDVWRVRFFAVNAREFIPVYDSPFPDTRPVVGIEFDLTAQIYLALPDILVKRLVMHEMVHYLMFRAGFKAGHPLVYYDGRCFGVREFFNDSTALWA